MLTKELLEEFKQIYFEEFRVELTDEETVEKATQLLNVFQVLVKPQSTTLISKDSVDGKDKEMQI